MSRASSRPARRRGKKAESAHQNLALVKTIANRWPKKGGETAGEGTENFSKKKEGRRRGTSIGVKVTETCSQGREDIHLRQGQSKKDHFNVGSEALKKKAKKSSRANLGSIFRHRTTPWTAPTRDPEMVTRGIGRGNGTRPSS